MALLIPGFLSWVGTVGAQTPQAPSRSLALQGRVSQPAFSPDGKLIATVGTDGAVRLWDVATAGPAGPPLELGHENTQRARGSQLLFSPNGKSLVWWAYDRVVVWDLASRQVIGRPAVTEGHWGILVGPVGGFSPDSQVLLLWTKDGPVFWSIAKQGPTGPPLRDVPNDNCIIRFSPDGRLAAVPTKDKVTLWDPVKGEPTGSSLKVSDFSKRPLDLVFSPDGRWLAVVDWNKVSLWDVATRQLAGLLNRRGVDWSALTLGGREFSASQVTFSPDGRVLAWLSSHGGQGSGEILLWDLAGQKPVAPPLDPQSNVRTVAFSPDSKMLVSQGDDNTVVLRDPSSGSIIEDGLLIGGKKGHHAAREPAFSANGETLAVRNGDFVELWDVVSRPSQLLRRFDKPGVSRVSPDGTTLALKQDDHLALWDLSSRQVLDKPVIVPSFDGSTIEFSPDSSTLASYKDATTGTAIVLWDVAAVVSPARGREQN